MIIILVIPAFNEEGTISGVVQSAVDIVDHVVLVNDASTDGTAKIGKIAGADVVTLFSNKGYQSALLAGIKHAITLDADYIVTCDADGQHRKEDIQRVVDVCRLGAEDLVIGVRPKSARLAERVFSFYSYKRFGIVDPLCGMKGYRSGAILPSDLCDQEDTINFRICKMMALRSCKICQISIGINERKDVPRFGGFLNANIKIFKALIRTLF